MPGFINRNNKTYKHTNHKSSHSFFLFRITESQLLLDYRRQRSCNKERKKTIKYLPHNTLHSRVVYTEMTSGKMRANDVYWRVEKYAAANEQCFLIRIKERLISLIFHMTRFPFFFQAKLNKSRSLAIVLKAKGIFQLIIPYRLHKYSPRRTPTCIAWICDSFIEYIAYPLFALK